MMMMMRPGLTLSRTARRYVSTRGPKGPRGILDKSRTPSRISSRIPKASPVPQNDRHHLSQRQESQQKLSGQAHQALEKKTNEQGQQPTAEASKVALVSSALAENESSDLVAPVRIPDDPEGVLDPNHPAWDLLNNSSLVIQRQLEMMNVFLGFEQANKYVIMNGRGETIGYMAEQDHGLGTALARQAFRTHRSFTSHIFDKHEREVLRIHRPFSWINSRIRIYDPCSSPSTQEHSQSTENQQISSLPLSEMRIIGEAQQQWAPLRRKYNLFNYRALTPSSNDTQLKLSSGDKPNTESKALTIAETPEQAIEAGMQQFSHVNEPFLSWDFTLKNGHDQVIGSVNRNFVGFAREIFTDTGVYALRMDSVALSTEQEEEQKAMTLDQRAVMLATAVSIDFDYFSRHSGAGVGGGFMPLWFPGMGGGAAEGGAAGGAAGEVGAAEGATGAITRGASGEGAIAGAGTMAGYEAMQRGRSQDSDSVDDASPTSGQPPLDDQNIQDPWANSGDNDPWNQNSSNDPWSNQQGGSSGGDTGTGGGGGGEGGGFDWGDFF